jgi:hypothetical protein
MLDTPIKRVQDFQPLLYKTEAGVLGLARYAHVTDAIDKCRICGNDAAGVRWKNCSTKIIDGLIPEQGVIFNICTTACPFRLIYTYRRGLLQVC